ncbi:hypothetical protein GM415_03335 [Pseudodesulfovibrio cashew]|uniref:PilZ domain-containing protein n=1 Tax=Pseudodesulfovibrio cashew TaxID=2678688 RepID=A0A6I6J8N8_9BACT|nr:PilZ domain-containing protein [Pseudodesulfovibrio cashew]QGY39196.1 hypothetical protein GM415_03335 [Pseudodesulfovibrio cashew]
MSLDKQCRKYLQVVIRENLRLSGVRPDAVEAFRRCLDAGNADEEERRGSVRRSVTLRAVIYVQKRGNEIFCLPAVIRNISASGVMLEVEDKGHLFARAIDEIEMFTVSFCLSGDAEPMTIECQPRHIEVSEIVGIGAEFSSLDGRSQRYLM